MNWLHEKTINSELVILKKGIKENVSWILNWLHE